MFDADVNKQLSVKVCIFCFVRAFCHRPDFHLYTGVCSFVQTAKINIVLLIVI